MATLNFLSNLITSYYSVKVLVSTDRWINHFVFHFRMLILPRLMMNLIFWQIIERIPLWWLFYKDRPWTGCCRGGVFKLAWATVLLLWAVRPFLCLEISNVLPSYRRTDWYIFCQDRLSFRSSKSWGGEGFRIWSCFGQHSWNSLFHYLKYMAI